MTRSVLSNTRIVGLAGLLALLFASIGWTGLGTSEAGSGPASNKVWGIGPELKSSDALEFENLIPVSV